jgi:hypothetical protein
MQRFPSNDNIDQIAPGVHFYDILDSNLQGGHSTIFSCLKGSALPQIPLTGIHF